MRYNDSIEYAFKIVSGYSTFNMTKRKKFKHTEVGVPGVAVLGSVGSVGAAVIGGGGPTT